MTMRLLLAAGLVTFTLLGCASKTVRGPTTQPPPFEYVPLDKPVDVVWDAVIDAALNAMTSPVCELSVIPGIRYVKIGPLVTRGPLTERLPSHELVTKPNPLARELVDCGTREGEQRAGNGDLYMSIHIRVRDLHGKGLVSVQTLSHQDHKVGPVVHCVSNGTMERRFMERITTYLAPPEATGR